MQFEDEADSAVAFFAVAATHHRPMGITRLNAETIAFLDRVIAASAMPGG